MIADMDPILVGAVDAEYKTILGKLNKLEIDALFYPRYNTVALEFKYQLTTYRQFWTQEGRELFIKAVESYNNDYDSRSLNRKLKFSKTRRAYGKFSGDLEWFSGKFSHVSESSPIYEIGYSFQGEKNRETPFLTVSQNSATEKTMASSDNTRINSIAVYLYFIREQAAFLARIFDQTALLSAIEPKKGKVDDYDGYTAGANEAYEEFIPK